MVKINLSKRLGELRMTQTQLSHLTGIGYSIINSLYNERAGRIKLDHLSKLCETLNCEIEDLIELIPNGDTRSTDKS